MSNLQFRQSKYRFSPSWIGTLATILCIPVFIKLGLWQYHKAEQKRALQSTFDAYLHASPVALPGKLGDIEAWRYRHVRLYGEYEPKYQIILDNQVFQERVGYHVVTPLHIRGGQDYVLVDRGWIPAQAEHGKLPAIATSSGIQEVIGHVWLPSTKYYSLESPQSGWQTIWQNMDISRYAKTVPFKVLPLVLRLDADSQADGFVRDWPLPAERIETNVSYAYQWFGFAVTALAIYIYMSMKKIEQKEQDVS